MATAFCTAQAWASAATIHACQTPARTEPPARSKKLRCSTANVSMVSLVSAPFDFNIFSLNTFSGYASVVSKNRLLFYLAPVVVQKWQPSPLTIHYWIIKGSAVTLCWVLNIWTWWKIQQGRGCLSNQFLALWVCKKDECLPNNMKAARTNMQRIQKTSPVLNIDTMDRKWIEKPSVFLEQQTQAIFLTVQ